jgi:hypothetical protein
MRADDTKFSDKALCHTERRAFLVSQLITITKLPQEQLCGARYMEALSWDQYYSKAEKMPNDISKWRMMLWNRLWVQYHTGYAFSRMEHSLIIADEMRNSSESSFRAIEYAKGTKE